MRVVNKNKTQRVINELKRFVRNSLKSYVGETKNVDEESQLLAEKVLRKILEHGDSGWTKKKK